MRTALILLLAIALANADFLIDRVNVTVSDIKADGSAHVHESIQFVMYGNYSNSIYDSGISSNELSFWSTNTNLSDARFHVNPSVVDIRDFRLRPQPRTKCNPIQGICHGELILDYLAYPSYNNTTMTALPGTGLFTMDKYKPRTERYTINPQSLAFTTTPEGNIILNDKQFLTIALPAGSVTLDVNPQPSDNPVGLPSHIDSLSWTDIVLVKFSLVFDVESSIDQEVSDFFSGILRWLVGILSGPQGFALIGLVVVLIGSYAYIIMAKRRGEE
jgi:hypothetical protein